MTPYLASFRARSRYCSTLATKYISGHSDVIAGLVVVKDKELARRLHSIQNGVSHCRSFRFFLLIRSIKTLARMDAHG